MSPCSEQPGSGGPRRTRADHQHISRFVHVYSSARNQMFRKRMVVVGAPAKPL